MPNFLLYSSNNKQHFSRFIQILEEKKINYEYLDDILLVNQKLNSFKSLDCIIFGPSIKFHEMNDILSLAKQAGHKLLSVCTFQGIINQETLIEYSQTFNHFIFDLTDKKCIEKKLSNLKSLIRIKENRDKFKIAEKSLQEESEKLVEVNVNNVKLIAEVNSKNKQLEIAKKDIRNMLDNIEQGFFTIDKTGKILEGYTRSVVDMFQIEPLNKTLIDVLRLESDKAATKIEWLDMIFKELIPFDDLKGLGEQSFSINEKFIDLDYKPIRNMNGSVEKIIVIATDKTLEKQYQEKALKEQAIVQLILLVIKDKNGFIDFIHESQSIIAYLIKEFAKPSNEISIPSVLRGAHTLKGNAAAYHLIKVSSLAHHLEDILAGIGNSENETKSWEKAKSLFFELAKAFKNTINEIEGLIGKFQKSILTKINMDKHEFKNFEKTLHQIAGDNRILITAFNDTFYHSSFHKHILKYGPIIYGMARRMGKKVSVKMYPGSVQVYIEPYSSLIQSLIHALRNAVDHGIEYPDERMEAGKEATGIILITIKLIHENSFQIRIRDDGNGIDTATVRNKAVEKGLLSLEEEKMLPEKEVWQLLLTSGFSTRDEVNEWSGRGVGMDAIAIEAKKIGGSVTLSSASGKFTELIITLPVILRSI